MVKSIEQHIEAILTPVIAEQGLELVDVEYVKEGPNWYLRIYVDKEDGVDIDDCTNISHIVSETLDRDDPISQAYMLEVSSPGLERPLKKEEDFERFKGKLARVCTTETYKGYKEFVGYLVGLVDDQITLEYQNETIKIPRSLVEKANLEIEF